MTQPPLILGKYEILAEIGHGGFATVYRARDTELERLVALKMLDPLLMRDPAWVQRFRREARAVAKFRHPRIVTIYDIGQIEGALFIAMELIEGGNLADYLAQAGRLPWEEALRLVGEIAEALEYAHGQGVLHRDLKPANVLIDAEAGAMLTDFGFARLLADNSLSVSLSGGVVGTPAYIAPEVWEGKEATPATDVYALGCILYELLAGVTLFAGTTPPAVMRAHFKPRQWPGQWPDHVPPGLDAVLQTALAVEPDARFASAGEFANALRRLAIDRLAEPYTRLEQAIAAGEWQTALTVADEIKAVNPDYRDVVALEQKALAGLAAAARQKQAAMWRAEAEQALTEGDWDGAERALKQWLALAPGDAAALALQERTREARSGEEDGGARERGSGGAGGVVKRRQKADEQPRPIPAPPPPAAPKTEPKLARRLSRRWAIILPILLITTLAVAWVINARLAPPIPQIVEIVKVVEVTATPRPPSATALPTLAPDETPVIGSVLVSERDGMELVYVPAGDFLMGSPEGEGAGDEHPQRTVTLDAFWIDKTEVTNAQFEQFVQASAYKTTAEQAGGGWTWTGSELAYVEGADWQHPQGLASGLEGLSAHPVVLVSWEDATAYCTWAGRRLPTEAEWEKAARGADGRIYPWGNAWDVQSTQRLNFADKNTNYDWSDKNADDGYAFTAPVGSYPSGASPYGALDMVGNVWEWAADWYDSGYYSTSPARNPAGPESGQYRVLRGGSWLNSDLVVRSASRNYYTPDARDGGVGFRCARS